MGVLFTLMENSCKTGYEKMTKIKINYTVEESRMLKKILARIIKWLRLITFSTLEILLFAFCWTMMMINLGEIHQSKYFFILNYRKLILKANKKIYENDNLSSFIKRFISIYYRSSEAVVYERFIFIFLFFSPLANNFYIFIFCEWGLFDVEGQSFSVFLSIFLIFFCWKSLYPDV